MVLGLISELINGLSLFKFIMPLLGNGEAFCRRINKMNPATNNEMNKLEKTIMELLDIIRFPIINISSIVPTDIPKSSRVTYILTLL